jgi:glycosyltransferase involved in cell wall biosynthesis
MTAAGACDVSVILCTYNRADRLPSALDALLSQAGAATYEIIVVDNNSSDATAHTVAEIARTSGGRVRYAFEPRQGLSHARNTGIALARAPIIAFSDDDVRVASDWVQRLKDTFDERPEIDYAGGRVLPHWLEQPPAWLTQAHWAPLALQDYGDAALVSGRERAVCLVGANLAFRRRVFERVGVFAPALGRVKDGIGSTEDHDMQLRAWRAGMLGLYVPTLLVFADVTPDRLDAAYHRRWHRGHGRHCAMMRLRELVPADLGPMSEPADIVKLFGSPAFVYRDLLRTGYSWARALWRQEDWRFYAHQWHHIWSYLRTSQELLWRGERRRPAAELVRFVRDYLRKRRHVISGSPDLSGTRFCKVTSIDAGTPIADHIAERAVRTNGK